MKTRWSLKQLFLWTFVVALIIPYLLAFIPARPKRLNYFSIDSQQLFPWIREVIPEAGGSYSGNTNDSRLLVSFKKKENDATEKLLPHLRTRIKEFIEESSGRVYEESSSEGTYFSMGFRQDRSHYRLYVWRIPLSEDDLQKAAERGLKVIKFKMFVVPITIADAP